MMRWQDLKDNLDYWTKEAGDDLGDAVFEVARRVLALWQPCGDCDGQGWFPHEGDPRVACSRCGGTGVTAKRPGPCDSWHGPSDLALYLFGEGDR